MTEPSFSAIRARLRYDDIEGFIEGYARFISAGGMFIPMAPSKLKPIGTTIRFQFMLGDGQTALLGEGVVMQVRPPDENNARAPVGMLIKFSKLSNDSKLLVDRIVQEKGQQQRANDSEPVEDEKPSNTRPFPEEQQDELQAVLRKAKQKEEPAPAAPSEAAEDPTHEMSLSDFLALERQRSEASVDEDPTPHPDRHTDPNTLEAPAPSQEVETEEAPLSTDEPEAPQPQKIAQTSGGLQILAFDSLSEDEVRELESASLFGGEEADIDQMFDGLFGSSEGEESSGFDDFFGAAFSAGPAETADVREEDSVEFALEEEVEPEVAPEPSLRQEEFTPVALSDDDPFGDVFADSNEVDEEPAPEESEREDFALIDEDDNIIEDESQALSLDDAFQSDVEEDQPVPIASAESSFVELSESGILEENEADEEVIALPPFAASEENELADEASEEMLLELSESDQLDEVDEPTPVEDIIGSVLDDQPLPPVGFATQALPTVKKETEPQPDDEESLESLLATAQKEIEAKRSGEEEEEGGRDILDDLIGDDVLPPPPDDAPAFQFPQGDKKKKGFISKLFGKD